MKQAVKYLDQINEYAGRFFAWSTSLMVLLICCDVLMRYCFDFTLIWIIELEIYFFAMSFLLASGYAFKYNKHVRVDVFYSQYSEKKKAWTDLIGGIFFLLPWALISCYVCFHYFRKSWYIKEASGQPGGLPALYVLKFILLLGFILLLIQAVSSILKSYMIIRDGNFDSIENNSKE